MTQAMMEHERTEAANRAEIVSRTVPWAHQREAFRFALDKPGVMLALDCGVGKSKVAIDLAVNRGHKFILILCPKSVVSVWPKQFELHAGKEMRVLPLTKGSVKQKQEKASAFWRAAYVDKVPAAVVTNYDSAWRSPLAEYLLRSPLDCVICDEVHRIAAADSKVSQFCGRLGMRVPWKVGLTGTPFTQNPLSVFGQYRFLSPSIFGVNPHAFITHYAVKALDSLKAKIAVAEELFQTDPGEVNQFNLESLREDLASQPDYKAKIITGYKNQDELQEKFYRIAYRVTKDVLDLPPEVHETRTCQLSPRAQRIYDQLEKELKADVGDGVVTVKNLLGRVLRLQQCTSGYAHTDGGTDERIDDGKAAVLTELMEDMDPAEPIVVFAWFRHDLARIREVALACGRKAFELSGSANELKQWQDREGCGEGDVLAIQTQSGGEGIEVVRARYVVYYSLSHSLRQYTQSLSRAHRPGQTRTVTFFYLVAERTVDEKILKRLEQRQEVIDGILNDYSGKEQ